MLARERLWSENDEAEKIEKQDSPVPFLLLRVFKESQDSME